MAIPGDLTTITVTDTYINADGTFASGTVTFTPTSQLQDATGEVVVTASTITATVNATRGTFSVVLPCTDNADLTPSPWAYTVVINVPGVSSQSFTALFPHTLGASVALRTVTPSQPPAPSMWSVVYSVNGRNGAVELAASDVDAVPLAGGTMTGPLILSADPAASLQAATKHYVDNNGGGAALDTNPADIQELSGTSAAGSAGLAADAGHVHPTTGLVTTSSLPLAIGSGGTGSASQNFVDLTTGQNVAGTKTFTGEVLVPVPVNSGDAATKAYVDAVAQGLSPKNSVAEATTAALPSNTYSNGSSGVGATLTGTATGTLTVDGQIVALNDRVLVQNESAAADNGIYLATTAGAPGVAYVLTRSTDMDTSGQVPGAFCFVEKGANNGGSQFAVAGAGPYTIGTTAISFTLISAPADITAGPGLTESGSVFSLAVPVSVADGGTGQITQQAAMDALAGAVTSGEYLRGGGSHVTMSAIHAADLPAATTAAQGAVKLAGDLAGTGLAPTVAKIQGTAIGSPPGGTADFLRADGTWAVPPGGSGTVTSVTAGDTSVVVGGTSGAPTIETATLDVIAADHPPAANWSNAGHKITSLANGSGAQDAAAYGQTPAGGSTVTIAQGGTGQTGAPAALNALGGAAVAGDIGGTSASPTVAKIQGTAVSAPSGGAARFLSAAGTWVSPALTPPSSPVTASTVTAAVGQFVACDTTSNAIAVTLPASGAVDQSQIGVKMITQGSSGGVPYTVTVSCASGDHFNVATTGPTSLTLSVAGQGVLLQYDNALAVWYVLADDIPLGQADIRYGATAGTIASATGTENLTLSTAATWNVTLAGNTTFAIEGPASPAVQSLTVYVTQAASGGPYSVTWPGTVTWFGGTPPPVSTSAAGALTVVTLQTINGGTSWYGGIVSNAALPLTVADGGTGLVALTTYELLAGGTGTTSPVQQISIGGTGQVLTSAGTGSLPAFQAPGAGPLWGPADSGLIAWNYDPCITNGGSQVLATAGQLYVMAMKVAAGTSVTNIYLDLTVVGSGITHGFAGLWQGAGGALLGQTADQATNWNSGSTNSAAAMPISGGPVAVTAGVVYVGVWFTGTTGPTFYKAAAQNFVNVGLSAPASRWGTANTGLTTTAPSALGTITASEYAYWAAVG